MWASSNSASTTLQGTSLARTYPCPAIRDRLHSPSRYQSPGPCPSSPAPFSKVASRLPSELLGTIPWRPTTSPQRRYTVRAKRHLGTAATRATAKHVSRKARRPRRSSRNGAGCGTSTDETGSERASVAGLLEAELPKESRSLPTASLVPGSQGCSYSRRRTIPLSQPCFLSNGRNTRVPCLGFNCPPPSSSKSPPARRNYPQGGTSHSRRSPALAP